jgi:HSP20 family protein
MASLQKGLHKSSSELTRHIMNPFMSIQKEVDRALHGFYDIFESKPFDLQKFENLHIAPAMDLVEDNQCYKVEAEMPGMDEKDITISIHDNMLTIHGEKSTSRKDEHKNYIAREINYGRYERCIALPQAADGEKATASFKKGMLWVTIPKKAGKKGNGHQIKIEKAV